MDKVAQKELSDYIEETILNLSVWYGFSKRRLITYFKSIIEENPDFDYKTSLMFISYDDKMKSHDKKFYDVNKAIISLVEEFKCKESLVIKIPKNGKSCLIYGSILNEILKYSKIDKYSIVSKNIANTEYSSYNIIFPIKRKMNCFGGKRICDQL